MEGYDNKANDDTNDLVEKVTDEELSNNENKTALENPSDVMKEAEVSNNAGDDEAESASDNLQSDKVIMQITDHQVR